MNKDQLQQQAEQHLPKEPILPSTAPNYADVKLPNALPITPVPAEAKVFPLDQSKVPDTLRSGNKQ